MNFQNECDWFQNGKNQYSCKKACMPYTNIVTLHHNSERVGFVYTLFYYYKQQSWRPIPLNKTTRTMNTSLALIAAKALPALSGSSLTYNAEKNVYLTLGYTSAAGNTYYRAIRLSDRLAVYYHIGQGYAHTFLNGITLFAWNGQKANIIAQKFWGGCNWRCFNERSAKEESILMLKDFLKGQAKAMGSMVAESQLLDFSRSIIETTHQKCLG